MFPLEGNMEKHVVRWTYLLGVACVVIALVWRALNVFGWGIPYIMVPGQTLYYMSAYKAAFLLLLTSIATANYAMYRAQSR
jgi:hypothetical protein